MRKLIKRKKKANRKLQKTSFFKNVVILLAAHVFIKILGVINKIYLTNREGFGDEEMQYILVHFKFIHYSSRFPLLEYLMLYQN